MFRYDVKPRAALKIRKFYRNVARKYRHSYDEDDMTRIIKYNNMIVTARDFRANQSKYIGYAHNGEDVILKSRAGYVKLLPVHASEGCEQQVNRVFIEDGDVKMDFVTDTMSIEEAKALTLKAIELEYALP